jgi:hypothetical protein
VSDPLDTTLDNCGCCESEPAPPHLYNRPGLPALAYRAGTYASFFRRMRNRIGTLTLPDGEFAGTRPLVPLTTRDQDDPSIALLDASAVVADVLTFYQERLANEGFLRTATERRSILEMAREIGYELNPGVAASVFLSFTVDDAQGAPGVSTIPAGTKVQSIPPQGKLPQSFETSQELTAYKEWNALKPRLTSPQDLTGGVSRMFLRGTGSNLKDGDLVLITSSAGFAAVHVKEVKIDSDAQITRVTFDQATSSIGGIGTSLSYVIWGDQKVPFDTQAIQQEILGKSWQDADLNAFLKANEWDPQALVDYLASYRSRNPAATGWAYAMRTRLGIFGDNAPKWSSLPASQRFGEWTITKNSDGTQGSSEFHDPAYPASWEGRDITTDSQGNSLSGSEVKFYLDRTSPAALPGGYVVLEQGTTFGLYTISAAVETSLSDYGVSLKVSGLNVTTPFVSPALNTFKVRTTTVYLQNEKLDLAELPLTTDLAAGTTVLELDSFVLGLQPGQPITLSGTRTDADGLTASEVLTVKEVSHNYGLTTITFESGLEFSYDRESVRLNANTVPATHGETVSEVLGSGDGAQSYQKFTLKKPPLTYTPAAKASGSESSLKLRINKLLWDLAPSLYGLSANDQSYIIRIDDDSKATVIFGDGQKGARLPTGVDNVTAVYRSGIGLEGEVEAGSLTLLPSKPFGVRGVINPLAASGAGDPEKMDDARDHAPLTVRTLDRVVSLDDYQDFASAFAGIGKAQAVDLWSGEHHLVHLTIAGANGKPITDSTFRNNFLKALNAARDPAQLVKVETFDQLLFNLTANVAVDERYVVADVFSDIRNDLGEAFSFAKRGFGQSITAAEVISLIQNVAGVVYVDLDYLYFSDSSADLNQILAANSAHVEDGQILHAQLLLLNNLGVTLQEVGA